jgi:hypothetical protein
MAEKQTKHGKIIDRLKNNSIIVWIIIISTILIGLNSNIEAVKGIYGAFQTKKDTIRTINNTIPATVNAGVSTKVPDTTATLHIRPVTPDAPVENPKKAELHEVNIISEPPGADIIVDGEFMGKTDRTLMLSAGDHALTIKGFGKEHKDIITLPGHDIITVDLSKDEKTLP